MDTITSAQFFICCFSHYWVHMNRINRLAFWMFIQHTADCTEHIMHRLSKIFPSMGCNKNHFTVTNPVKFRMSIVFFNSMLHCINNCITCNKNLRRIFPFFNKVIRCHLCRCKVILRNNAYRLTVKFFWIRRINIISTKTSLNMPNRNLQIKASQSGNKCCRRITMYKYNIWLYFFKHSFNFFKNSCCNIK